MTELLILTLTLTFIAGLVIGTVIEHWEARQPGHYGPTDDTED